MLRRRIRMMARITAKAMMSFHQSPRLPLQHLGYPQVNVANQPHQTISQAADLDPPVQKTANTYSIKTFSPCQRISIQKKNGIDGN